MSLKVWADNGWLRHHQTSENEIANLIAIVERDFADASGDVSTDARFGSAYKKTLGSYLAGLLLKSLVLMCSG